MSEPPEVLREYRVKIVPAHEAGPQPVYPNNFGLRTKFGGTPEHIQEEEEPTRRCSACGHRMHFVAQLDSFEFNGENNPNRKDYGDEQFMFADVGMIYVWFCFSCATPAASLECN